MIQNVLRDIGAIGTYGVISVCLFFTVFTVAMIRALLLKKPAAEILSSIPLQDGTQPQTPSEDFIHE